MFRNYSLQYWCLFWFSPLEEKLRKNQAIKQLLPNARDQVWKRHFYSCNPYFVDVSLQAVPQWNCCWITISSKYASGEIFRGTNSSEVTCPTRTYSTVAPCLPLSDFCHLKGSTMKILNPSPELTQVVQPSEARQLAHLIMCFGNANSSHYPKSNISWRVP